MPDAPSTFIPDSPSTFVPDETPDLSQVDIPQVPASAIRRPPVRAELAQATPVDKEGAFSPFVPLGPDIQAQTLGGQLLAAPYNVGKGLLEGVESRGGLATLPLGGTGKLAQGAIGAGFGLPAMYQGAQRVYRGTALGEPQEALEGALQVLTGGLITGGAAHTALAPEVPRTFIPETEKPPIISPPKISEVTPAEAPPIKQAPPAAVTEGESPAAPAVSAADVPVAAGTVPAKVEDTPIRTTTQGDVQVPSGPQMGAAGLGEVEPTGTSLKNAVGEMERVGLGLQEAPENVQRNMAAAWERSGQVEAAAPGTGKSLADSLIADPERGLTDADSALLLRHKTDLFNRMNDAAERSHIGDDASRASAQQQYNELAGQFSSLLDAVDKRGSEWGREGRWRQAMANPDFTFQSVGDMNLYHRTLTGEDMPGEKVANATRKSREVKDAKDASDKATNAVVDDLRAQVPPPTPEEVVKRKAADDQAKATQRALDAAYKTVRDAAARLAEAETKRRVATTVREREVADIQRKAAQKAVESAEKLHRQAAIDLARAQRKLQDDPIRAVWTKVKEHIDKGESDPNNIRNKVATDLGMSVDRVTRIMGQNPRTKFLMDEAWRKQQLAQTLRQNAKMWVRNLDIPNYEKALSSIPRILFGLKVGFHGTVALGTHAPTVAFQPRFWSSYIRDFGKMYKMVGSPAFYEREVQDLVRRKNYTTAKRAGLVNDPNVYENFSDPDTAKYFGRLTGMGNRGYSILKILRQDMFDQMYDELPRSLQVQKSVTEALADQINHATGVVQGYAPRGTNMALFAPRLAGARIMQLAGDPIRMTRAFINWDKATPGEKLFAMNQLKEKAWIAGTLFSALALNQGFLQATGSKQKVNGIPKSLGGAGFDPLESDFLKFKAAGYDLAYGSAVLNLAKLPVRMATALMYHGKTSKLVLEDERMGKIAQDYVRSQLSPFAGTTADLLIGRDYAGRPLPRAGFGLLPGRTDIPKRLRLHGTDKPYTWAEYGAQQFTPIPISEGIREVWKHGLGMSDKQINEYLKAFAVSSFMASTGTRVNEDRNLEKEQ